MKQQIQDIIKKHLPKWKISLIDERGIEFAQGKNNGFIEALSNINTSLIADEVLKVVVKIVEKSIENGKDKFMKEVLEDTFPSIVDCIRDELLSNLSPNKENEK